MVARVWGKTCLLGLLFVNCLAAGWAQIPTEAYDVNSTKVFSIDGEGNLWCSGAVTQGLASIDEPAATTDFCAAYDDAGQIVMLVEVYDNATATSLGNVKLVGELEFSDAPTLEAGDHWGQSDTGVYQAVLKSNGNLVLSGTAPLGQPSDVVLVVRTAKRIDVQWRDNASAETGYEIYVSTDAENYALVGTTSADATMFSLKGLVPNTWYDVRVCATDGQNDSPYSEVKTAATLTESFFCETWDEVTTPMLPANEFVAASSGFTWEADRWYWTWTTENEYATSCGLTASAPEYGCGLARSLASDQAGDYEMLTEMPCFHFADDRELTASFEVQCDQIGADLGRLFTLTLRSETDYSGGGSGVQISLDAQSTQAALKIESVAAGTQVSTTVSTSTLPVAGGTGRYWIQASFKRQDEAVAVQYQMYNANDIDSPFFIGDTTLTNLPGDGLERVSLNFEQRSVGVLDDIELASLGENEDRQASERVFEDDTPNIIDATEPDTIPEPEITSGEQSVTLQSSTTVASGYSALRLSGTASGDGLGYSVSSAGDVNGDGFDDILAGAPWSELYADDETGKWDQNSGAARLIFGPVSANANSILFRPDARAYKYYVANDISEQSAPSFALGLHVAGAGDVNRDGYADLLIGAPWGACDNLPYQTATGGGEVYLVYGGTQFDGVLSVPDRSKGVILQGEQAGDNAGAQVASAGDFDADGYVDLLVGAPQAEAGGYKFAGKVYLISGRRLLEGQYEVMELARLVEREEGLLFEGARALDRAGTAVCGAGDLNGDGYADIAIGAPGVNVINANENVLNNAGKVYIIYGKPFEDFESRRITLSDTTADETLDGQAAGDQLGHSVAFAGDVNEDGIDDLLVGAPYYDSDFVPASDHGKVYLVLGGASITTDLSAVTYAFVGSHAGDLLGWSVAGLGDTDGDGKSDFLLGAPGYYDTTTATRETPKGKAYLVRDVGTTQDSRLIESLNANGNVTLTGDANGDWLGQAVGGAGDVFGAAANSVDGMPDALVGAPKADPSTFTDAGQLDALRGMANASTLPTSSAYETYFKPGYAPSRPVGAVTQGTPASRCWLAFNAGSDQNDQSLASITLNRSKTGITHLGTIIPPATQAQIADVYWHVETQRQGWNEMMVMVQYLESEITGLTEDGLQLYGAASLSGPWVLLNGSQDTQTHRIWGVLSDSSLEYFAIAQSGAFTVESGSASDGVLIRWDDMSDLADFLGYIIYRSTSPDENFTAITDENTLVTDLSYLDETAQTGTTYYYCIKAVTSSGSVISTVLSDEIGTTCQQPAPQGWM